MKNVITGIMVLLVVLAVTFAPLSAKAEMQVMTDNEIEMITGQVTVGGVVEGLMGQMGTVINMQPMLTALNPVLTPVLKSKFMGCFSKAILVPIMAWKIPFTK